MPAAASSRFWKRFRRNRLALLASGFIALVMLIALFAYPLSPDDSPDAHTLVLEIATLPAGSRVHFLREPLPSAAPEPSFLQYCLHGRERAERLIPIRSWRFDGDTLRVNKVVDEELVEPAAYALRGLFPSYKGDTAAAKRQLLETRTFWLGTDRYGRDLLSRLILGSRVSMAVGIIAVLLSISLGVFLGALSGYFGGRVDQLITWLINVVWAIPTLLLVFAITFVLGKGFWQIFVAVGLTMWVGTARLIRGQVMALRDLEYIQATRVMGFSSARILLRHILPNVLGPTVVMAASNFATAILIEAGLSFLGIGVQPPVSSWGLMIKENYNFIVTNRPLLALVPGVAIMLIVLAFNIVGNALRDALDVRG
jgi:ABC-type dipeptide/oligopeptide/nickel transport system permease subunit